MTRTLARLFSCVAFVAAPAAVAATQEPLVNAETDGDEIIVQGYTVKEVRNFLWRAIVETGDVISRRSQPICIGIDNAPPVLADPVKARMEANLAALKIAVAEPGCKANTIIVFHENAHGFVNWLEKQDNGAVFASLYKPEKRRLIKPVRQAYAWHYIPTEAARLEASKNPPLGLRPGEVAFQTVNGGEVVQQMMRDRAPADSTHSFAVIDTDAIDGLTIEQVGDYLTMQILVELRPEQGDEVPPDSILNLFTATGNNPDAPPALSPLDLAILSHIYTGTQNFNTGSVRAGVARRVVSDLKSAGQILEEGNP